MKFVSTDGNENITVHEGAAAFEVVDSSLSHKKRRRRNRKKDLKDVVNILGGETDTEEGGVLFTPVKSDAPDPRVLLDLIDEINQRDRTKNEKAPNKPDTETDALSELLEQVISNNGNSDEPLKMSEIVLDGQEPENDPPDNPAPAEEDNPAAAGDDDPVPEDEYEEDEYYDEPEYEELEEKIKELEAELEAKNNRIAELEKVIEEKDSNISEINEQHKQKVKELEEAAELEADEAYKKGMEEGNLNAQETINGIQSELAEISTGIPKALNSYLEELEEQMKNEVCSFSLSIAETLIGREFKDREVIKETISSALSPIINYNGVVLYLNPQTLEWIKNDELVEIPNPVTLKEDSNLGLGDVYIETSMGFIDATLKRRLKELRETFSKPGNIERS